VQGLLYLYRYRINFDVLMEIIVNATVFVERRGAGSFEISLLINQITESYPSIT
jgi:hypothetical protein